MKALALVCQFLPFDYSGRSISSALECFDCHVRSIELPFVANTLGVDHFCDSASEGFCFLGALIVFSWYVCIPFDLYPQ